MENKGGLVLGLLALVGLAVLIVSQRSQSRPRYRWPQETGWTLVRPGEMSVGSPTPPPQPPAEGHTTPRVVYENEQTITLKRGPDRLLEEMIIHRKVITHE